MQPFVHDAAFPLYDPRWEHDACGTGMLVQISGEANHALVETALQALIHLTHRGAQDADAETSDGSGLMTSLPRTLLLEELGTRGISLPEPEDLAVGMIFLPSAAHHPEAYQQSRQIIEQVCHAQGLHVLGWRQTPVDRSVLGQRAHATAPDIAQILLNRPPTYTEKHYDRALYATRRLIEQRLHEANIDECYIASLSRTTIIYKGLLAPGELARFYLDLAHPRYMSSFAIFHQRYSTNTFPAWGLAQPMRFLAHNGEINTIQGNRSWMQAREGALFSPLWGSSLSSLLPVIQSGSSDSGQLDNVVELLTLSGRDLLHSMQMLIPPAWEQNAEFSDAQRAWCEYHAGQIEPWDGPAALIFSDGRFVGATLDRNGLRPARYTLTSHGTLILASEAGVVPMEPHEIVECGRLGPGEMLAVDLKYGVLLRDGDIKSTLANHLPYEQWLEQRLIRLVDCVAEAEAKAAQNGHLSLASGWVDTEASVFERQQLFGYTHEDIELVLRPILTEKKEPVWSMGDDTPVAALSQRSRSFADYFSQRFAQVTNPPIDSLRERVVMSLDVYLGRRQTLLTETALHARLLHIETPLLTEAQLAVIRGLSGTGFSSRTLDITFDREAGTGGLEAALNQLENEAITAVADGTTLLVLSDRSATLEQVPLPMLIAVGAIHQALVRRGMRTYVSLICETGAAWDIHQLALLLGYGAEAIVPYLALTSIRSLAGERKLEHLTPEQAVKIYLHAVEDGLRKVMARMGISTIRNIIGAGQFEVLGLEPSLIERCFTGSASCSGNVTIVHIAEQVITRTQALSQAKEEAQERQVGQVGEAKEVPSSNKRRKLLDIGTYRFRRDAEYHAFNPILVRALQQAAQSGQREDYARYTALVYQRPPTTLRDLLTFAPTTPIPLEQIEPMESIRARFLVSAMSIGALSPETHRTIAAAMNSIGCRNNTGEGGEDPAWYHELLDGYPVSSKIKQVASARFGVTPEYLVRAEELEIKMAQGSKPGEGGQLPPMKVTPFIAKLRHTAPTIALISPPPHHDIYSIEDLAQLIYDLRAINPQARIGVKLVSSLGVGTIAAGVAKAHADYVLISGHDGGTGASPMQSIKHAGISWEYGLAETQQVLLKNGLRSRVKVRVDGGLKTGRDVIIAALLGAEEFGFGTSALVTLGCDMARQCHLNTCPTGIATQREDLRAKFTGKGQHLVNYFTLLAEEVREWLAQLGVASLDGLIGRADLLVQNGSATIAGTRDLATIRAVPDEATLAGASTTTTPIQTVPGIDLSPLLVPTVGRSTAARPSRPPLSPLATHILAEAEPALEGEHSVLIQRSIHNYDRAIGVSLAGEIARRYGNAGLPGISVTCILHGSAGQSFGAFCLPGMRLVLHGEANDYVGKGMRGGEIVIAPPTDASFAAHANTILGNTVLYGATGGQLFAAGQAGERFAVRNSGALAVVEGTGAHACEYMTGGMVVVLGKTGQNFGAGMSAGVAYVLDTQGSFPSRCNTEMVELQRLTDSDEIEALRGIIQRHRKKTHSWRAAQLLAEWSRMQRAFWRVVPVGSLHSARDYIDVASEAAVEQLQEAQV